MILAAGLGTRLRPLTDERPKALIEVGGVPMLERVARRLIAAGADRLIVNVHHFADAVEAFLVERRGFGVEVVVSREEEAPLETGGGILHAARHFRREAPFFVHNVDIITDIPLDAMYADHRTAARADERVLGTLAVHVRDTRRHLLVDDAGLLGRVELDSEGRILEEERVRAPSGKPRRLAFAGIHVVEPRFLDLVSERGTFSVLDPYLRLVGRGWTVRGFDVTGRLWLETGTPERLARARAWAGPGDADGPSRS